MTVTMDFLQAQRRAQYASRLLLAVFALYALGAGLAYHVVMRGIVERLSAHLGAFEVWGPLAAWLVPAAFVSFMVARGVRTYRHLADPDETLSEAGARPVALRPQARDERRVRNVVEEVAVAASMPVPSVWIMDGQGGLNAMAAGAGERQAVMFTDAAVQEFSRDELQAVAAHEIAHLASGDTRINTLTAAFVAGAGAGMAPFLWVGGKVLGLLVLLLSSVGGDSRQGDTQGLLSVLILGIGAPILPMFLITAAMSGSPVLNSVWILLTGLVPLAGIGFAGHAVGTLLTVALSRRREHHADALALQLTRHAEALSSAIRRVARQPMKGHVITPERARLDHFFFARPTTDPPALSLTEAHPDLGERARLVAGHAPDLPLASRRATRQRRPQPPRPGAGVGALRSSLAVLPAPLLDACHDAARAPLAILAVLAAEGETPEADARHAITAAAFDPDAVYALKSGLRAGADLLPAIEVAMPALRDLDGAARERLATAVRALIAADQKTTLAEHAILQMLRWGFAPPPEASGVGKALGAEISRASDVLFACIASVGSPLASAQAEAVAAGQAALRATLSLPAPEAVPAAPFAHLDSALDVLRRASRVQRHAVLDAAHAVVAADGRTLREETALLRAGALAMGVACVVHPEPLAPENERSEQAPEAVRETETPLAAA
ncbi:M48 family metalloprotease [Rubricoccus marinus]|uniref:Peptidase M48 domain-containing protein n=1 Tax=Rubricoccus marinus TaxID=716817 RepID=A0A259TY24_9BACT|nr:M48 family metalloprotease [Rubricoccus marinus]OZC02474.1 hypothetical protein BSZ36_05465 [Rubricoccus marinus]